MVGQRLALALVLASARLLPCGSVDFSDTHLYVTPSETQAEVEIQLDFRISDRLNGSDVTHAAAAVHERGRAEGAGPEHPRGDVILSPTSTSRALGRGRSTASKTRSGTRRSCSTSGSRCGSRRDAPQGAALQVEQHRVYCGFADVSDTDDDEFQMWTNSSAATTPSSPSRTATPWATAAAPSATAPARRLRLLQGALHVLHGLRKRRQLRPDREHRLQPPRCPVGPSWGQIRRSERDGGRPLAMCSDAGECDAEKGECACSSASGRGVPARPAPTPRRLRRQRPVPDGHARRRLPPQRRRAGGRLSRTCDATSPPGTTTASRVASATATGPSASA